jgi:transcriptional regulator with XRE-family HTH domain
MPASEPTRIGELLCRIRQESGLSQRAFAEVTGTSGPTLAAYERGAKEPRLSTLDRMARRANYRVDVRLVPNGRGAALRARRERRSLALAAATASVVAADFPAAQWRAEENLQRSEEVVGDNAARRWISEWRDVLDRGPDAVRMALLDQSPHGHDMRQMTPFAGLLSDEERNAALAAVDAIDEMTGAA